MWPTTGCLYGGSQYGSCPLCGLGEFGAEHLIVWRPVVAAAWRQLGDGNGCLITHMRTPRHDDSMVGRLVHQASFLACSLRGPVAGTWQQRTNWLVRACRASPVAPGNEGVDDEDEELDCAEARKNDEGLSTDRWELTNGGCAACSVNHRVRVQRSVRASLQRRASRPGLHDVVRLATIVWLRCMVLSRLVPGRWAAEAGVPGPAWVRGRTAMQNGMWSDVRLVGPRVLACVP